jgi:hypothetical protein
MVQIDVSRVAAPRHHTPPPIAPENLPTNCRRCVLPRALTLQSSRHSGPPRGVELREFRGTALAAAGVPELSDPMPQRGVEPGELAGSTHRARRPRELIGFAPVGVVLGVGVSLGVGLSLGVSVGSRDRDFLRVAVTHLDNCRIELDEVAVRVLKAATAILALRDHHLVTGAPRIAWTA